MRALDVAVVGAGPYGLSVAAHLSERGLRVGVFGEPMDSWRSHMPEGMFLKSEGFATNLSDPGDRWTLKRFCSEAGHSYADIGRPIPLEVFADYGLWFAERASPDLQTTLVRALRDENGCFGLELDDGSALEARSVVVATGVSNAAYLPPELESLPPGRVSHTADHATLAPFADRDVAVVGAGQSALEAAALLHEAGARPSVLVRAPETAWTGEPPDGSRPLYERLRWPISPLGTGIKLWAFSYLAPAYRLLPEPRRLSYARSTLGPAGSWWLRERVEGRVPVLLGHRILRGDPDGDRIALTVRTPAGERELSADHVLAGTGYRIDVDRFAFLDGALRGRLALLGGSPRLSARFESSVPGLYFVGLPAAPSFGPVMRFVCGSRLPAHTIASHLRRRPAASRAS